MQTDTHQKHRRSDTIVSRAQVIYRVPSGSLRNAALFVTLGGSVRLDARSSADGGVRKCPTKKTVERTGVVRFSERVATNPAV